MTDESTNECNPESILDKLRDCRVFDIYKRSDDSFELREGCDGYFMATLTRNQMLSLIEKLKVLVGQPSEQPPNA